MKDHFRSYSIKEESGRTKKLWEKCISSKDLIPAIRMKYFDENGTTVIVKLSTLNHFQVNEKHILNNLLNTNQRQKILLLLTPTYLSLNTTVYNHQKLIYPTFLLQHLHYTRNIKQN